LGTSNWQNISYNIDLVKRLDPKSILDIGVGFGRWGILFREFLEVWGERNYTGKWNRRIDGVEIFPGYLKDYHKYFYSNIYNEEALSFMRKLDIKYDLINCGDVIEHLEKNDALELIRLCLEKSQSVLINIPIGDNWEQGAINNNEYERHRSSWQLSDFADFKYNVAEIFEDVELRKYLVILISSEPIDLTKAYGKHFRTKCIMKNKLGLSRLVNLLSGSK
jgi:SAM-dependent methyltransferase